MPTTAWRWYAGLGLGAVAVGGFLPVLPRQGLYTLVGVAAAVAVGIGIRRHRPPYRRSWLIFGASIWCSVLAAVLWAAEMLITGRVGFPAWKDAGFLIAYPGAA